MDYWKLDKLFRFSDTILNIFNDTDNIVEIEDMTGCSFELKPNNKISFGQKNLEDAYVIPNQIVVKYSDKSIKEIPDFKDNLYQIMVRYTDAIYQGQIIEAKNFLNYHYKWTKRKREFLQFVKYYIQSKSWITVELRDKYIINDSEIDEWIKRKEKLRQKRKYIFIILMLIILILLLGYFYCFDINLIIGTVVGALISQITHYSDKMLD